jgi:uncharacterized membrane protein
MAQPASRPPGNLPWLIRRGRTAVGIVTAVAAYLLTQDLPDEINLLIPFDIGIGVYLALFVVLMNRASPEDAAELSRQGEPNSVPVLIVVLGVSVFSLVGVAAMLNHPAWPAGLASQSAHVGVAARGGSVVVLSHVYFGLYYMRLYYDDRIVDGKVIYHQGLEFPERELADFWDFMYYSFTIAMCYQTSDISVTSVRIRHVTLIHSIYSFLYVTAIIGFVVNIISDVV